MKARYNFWSDRPRNVSRREFDRYQLIIMGMVATTFLSALTAFLGISGIHQRLRGTEELPSLSVAEVMDNGSAAPQQTDFVKVQGFLVADAPLAMPDEPGLKVIRGKLLLKAEAEQDDELLSETLLDWEETAAAVFLSDGPLGDPAARLPIAFDLAQLPMEEDRMARAKLRYAGDSARTSDPVAVEYGEEIYPLGDALKAAGAGSGSVSARLTREYLVEGEAVVVLAALKDGALVDPLGDRLQVLPGTEASIVEANWHRRVFLLFASAGLGVLAYKLKQLQAKTWQEFVARSNS